LCNAEDLFNQSRGNTARNRLVGDDTSNDGDSAAGSEESGDSGDYINILDVLDGRADHGTEGAVPANHVHAESQDNGPNVNTGMDEDDDTDGEEAEETQEDEQDPMLSADEDVSPSALEGLEKFVSSLEASKKRKGDSDATNGSLPRKKRFVEEKTAVGVEGEFTAVTTGMSNAYLSVTLFPTFLGQRLQLDDLLAPMSSHSSAVLSLEKSVKALDSSRTRGAPLSAPLPQRTQDRLDREAAYEQTKTEVDKWKQTMQQIKDVVPIPLRIGPR
jgi:U3 small nucleolar RNA-associated protein 14